MLYKNKRLFNRVGLKLGKKSFLFTLVGFLFLVVISIGLSSRLNYMDSGLYHVQSIKWIKEYPVIPGLGNLHGRFAFNSHFFISSALSSFSFIHDGKSILIHPLNASCIIVMVFHVLFQLKKSIAEKNQSNFIFNLTILILTFLLYPSWIYAPSPDIISAVIVISVLTYFFQRSVFSKLDFTILTLLVFFGISVKLSNAFLAFVFIPMLMNANFKIGVKEILSISAIGILIFTPFFIRNYYLSGYLVYPLGAIDIFTVDWKVPLNSIVKENELIKWWSRYPSMQSNGSLDLSFGEWFPYWWSKKSIAFKGILLLNSTIPLLLLFKVIRNSKVRQLSLLVLVNLMFWFLAAPDPRFVHGFLIIGTSIVLIVLSDYLPRLFRLISNTRVLVPIGLTVVIIISILRMDISLKKNWLWPTPIPENTMAVYQTNFKYLVPKEDPRCYNAELPCLPFRDDKVMQRGDRIEDGFYKIIELE
jgi:hypothetical protein